MTTIILATAALLAAGDAPVSGADATGTQVAPTSSPTAASPVQAGSSQRGVLVFRPDFFVGQRPNTALDMVARVPGFVIDDGSGSRGFEGAVGNILINGARPASKSDRGSNVLSRTAAGQVERIELIRGGAPGIDMQNFAVVVNVILRSGGVQRSTLALDARLFDGGRDMFGATYEFTASQGDRRWGVTLVDNVFTSDSNGEGVLVRTAPNGDVIRREELFTDLYGGGLSARGNYAGPLFGGKIDLTARYATNDIHNISRQTSPVVRRESLFDTEDQGGEVGAVFVRPLDERLTVETRLIHQWSDFESASRSRTRNSGVDNPAQAFSAAGQSSESILRSLARFERSQAVTFEVGGELAYNMREVVQAFTIGGIPVPLPSDSVLVEETRGEAFGKGAWRVSPELTLEGGLRLEVSTISQSGDAEQTKNLFFAKPRLLATWTPASGTQWRLRLERVVGQLDFGDFAASADLDDEDVFGGNADLEPEQRWIGELTYERRFLGDGIVSLGLRHDEISDVLDVIPLTDGLSATGNIGDGTRDQLTLNITTPTDRVGITGGRFSIRNTWNHTEVTDPTTGEIRPISDVPGSQTVMVFEQDISSWKLRWGGSYVPRSHSKSFDPDQTAISLRHDIIELWSEYKPTPTVTIRAQVNLADDFNVERTVFANRTPARPVAFVDNRFIDPRTFLSLRLRKTF